MARTDNQRLAIAVVTAAIKDIISAALRDIAGAHVVMHNPGRVVVPGEGPLVSVYLFGVRHSEAQRDRDPVARGEGAVPEIALDLNYAVFFTGDEGRQEPQRMLGAVLRSLHVHSSITASDLQQASADLPWMGRFDAAAQGPIVLTLRPLPIEAEARLWSHLSGGQPHQLAVFYTASGVLI